MCIEEGRHAISTRATLSDDQSHRLVLHSRVHCLAMEANLGQLAKSSTKNPESSMPRIADLELVHLPAKAGSPSIDNLLLCAVAIFGLKGFVAC
jgi:hypothetical protein